MHSIGGITSADTMNSYLFSKTLTDAQKNALYNDPDFGLSNVNNYFRWDALMYGRDPILLN